MGGKRLSNWKFDRKVRCTCVGYYRNCKTGIDQTLFIEIVEYLIVCTYLIFISTNFKAGLINNNKTPFKNRVFGTRYSYPRSGALTIMIVEHRSDDKGILFGRSGS